MANYIVPISKGLLEPKHSALIASPLGLFIFLIDRTTREVNGEGLVLGGMPIAYKKIADTLGANERSLRRWAEQLENAGYIRTARTSDYGKLRWWVLKSKKFGRTKMDTRDRIDRTKSVPRPPNRPPNLSTPIRPPNLSTPIREDREITVEQQQNQHHSIEGRA